MTPLFLPPALRLLRPREPIEQELCFAEASWTAEAYAGKAAALLAVPGTWRAVVYGRPGAGKSVFAAHAARGLEQSGPLVPLLFSLGSRRHPDDLAGWLNRRLAQAYPSLRRVPAAGPGGRAARLVRTGDYLFILDGLDEMPQRMRRWAMEEINEFFGPGDPLMVVTGDTGLDTPLPLAGAQHIGIQDAAPATVADHLDVLSRMDPPNIAGTTAGFDRLAKAVRSDPAGATALLLSRPLDLALTVRAMRRGLLWPADLTARLDAGGVAGARELLLDLEVAGALNGPGPCGSRRARTWLAHLAGHRQAHLGLAHRRADLGLAHRQAHLGLALSGRRPWRLGAFLAGLDDAGLLRREGRLYQFRHAEIRDHVAPLS